MSVVFRNKQVKKRILFLMPNWNAKSESWMQGIMKSLGNNLTAICVWNSGFEKAWDGHIPVISLTNLKTGFTRLISYALGNSVRITASKIIEKTIKKYEIDVVLVNYGEFALRFIDTWRKTEARVFVYFHGYDTQIDLRRDDDPSKRYFDKLYKNGLQELSKYSTFIANSKFARGLLIKDFGINPKKIKINYPGVPIPAVPARKKKTQLQILHLGRLIDTKSPDRTIKAFELASDNGLLAKIIVAGSGPLREKCELMRSKSVYRDSIQILGAVDHGKAVKLLEETDIYTQHNVTGEKSHQTECFGVSVIEAMSYGIPVVSTRSGGIVESVVSGETGILVKPGDINAQARVILKLARNEGMRTRMGRDARKRVIKYFSLEVRSRNLQKILGIG